MKRNDSSHCLKIRDIPKVVTAMSELGPLLTAAHLLALTPSLGYGVHSF